MNLYDVVLKGMDGSEELLSGDQCSKISMMNCEVVENIFLLILNHFVLNNKGVDENLMDDKDALYKSKYATKDGKGVKFIVSNLPDDLQKIIYRYLKLISD